MNADMVRFTDDGRCELNDPAAMPSACGFLFNPSMMMQVNCRGYATAQHMQPEPARYAHGPNLEATVFMQPEQPYYAHHPGRFVYLRDEADGELFSLPHEPVRARADRFLFSVGATDIRWLVERAGLECRLGVSLPVDDAVELWTLEITNTGDSGRELGVFPCFSIGYASWMNRSAAYEPGLGGIVARSVTGYQKREQWAAISRLKDCTFLLHDTPPAAWEASLAAFEGEGGLHDPDGIRAGTLGKGDALYETPAAVLQYRLSLGPGERRRYRFMFGPARDDEAIAALRARYLCEGGFETARAAYRHYLAEAAGCLEIDTPDPDFNAFANHWLGRQVFYHGSNHRLATDPQTRNFLQDAMGAVYVRPALFRTAILTTLAQQEEDGALPDGIRLFEGAELKYINQVPHSDHAAWLPVCLEAYLDETDDYDLLDEPVTDARGRSESVFERIGRAMEHLRGQLDGRGLSLIAQGDWCDPMNGVGPEGRGVSGWLSIATIHAFRLWAVVCRRNGDPAQAGRLESEAERIAMAVRELLWAGDRFARGITDNGRRFGTRDDDEGRLYLNPQSWALMAGIADSAQEAALLEAVEDELETPFGPQMLAPAYTRFQEDIGRLTQKFPGTAENGSVYNHAAAFYIHALFIAGHPDHAWRQLRRMLPGPDGEDLLRRGQLPVFLPNYYRGAVDIHPRTAGRSSQLFHTGTASWIYRILVEQLFGLKGCREGLAVRPALPSAWQRARAVRRFRGATFRVCYERRASKTAITVNGDPLHGEVITGIEAGNEYDVTVLLPDAER